jgi:hypothetical protein
MYPLVPFLADANEIQKIMILFRFRVPCLFILKYLEELKL